MFSGFACLFALQHNLKQQLDIPDDQSARSFNFSYCVSALYWGQVVFRFGHEGLLRSLSAGQRSQLALTVMGFVLLALWWTWTRKVHSLPLVGLAYFTGGAGLGTFEGNFVQLLGQLHPEAKLHGISGIPVGIFLVVVVGFALIGLGLVSSGDIYAAAGIACFAAVWLMQPVLAAPGREAETAEEVWSPVVESAMRSGRRSVAARADPGAMKKVQYLTSVVYFLNMSIVSCWSPGVLLYVYNSDHVTVTGLGRISTSLFFSVFSSFGFVADLVSRKLIYLWSVSPPSPVYFLALSVVGVSLLTTRSAMMAPLGTLLVFLGNGSIYACSCRLIDNVRGDDQVRSRANSLFFAAGDVGSIIGASLIPHIAALLTTHSLVNV